MSAQRSEVVCFLERDQMLTGVWGERGCAKYTRTKKSGNFLCIGVKVPKTNREGGMNGDLAVKKKRKKKKKAGMNDQIWTPLTSMPPSLAPSFLLARLVVIAAGCVCNSGCVSAKSHYIIHSARKEPIQRPHGGGVPL